jgi:hypothetical protein
MNTQTTEKNLEKCKCCHKNEVDRTVHISDERADGLCHNCANFTVLLIASLTAEIIRESVVVRSVGPATVFNH